MKQPDWHPADIIAGLRKKGTSLAAVSRGAGLSSSTLANALTRPWARGEKLIADALEIARLMGLRSQEAVQSSQSLKTWLKTIERGEIRLKVVFGTKGGRPRYTTILDAGAVRKVLEMALLVADRHDGRLIDKPDLKTAMNHWHRQAAKVGLTGEFSPHSLRYAWAQDAIRHYLT
ncbi:hypothetical protein BKN84_01955 [Salmonella enterica]|nr:hypothetical protein [Salmonella enterica]EBQ2136638.1 hypothetical protein [Salmonella enterica]